MGGEGGITEKGAGFKPVLQNVVFKNVFRNGGFGSATWAKKIFGGVVYPSASLAWVSGVIAEAFVSIRSFRTGFFLLISGYFIRFGGLLGWSRVCSGVFRGLLGSFGYALGSF